MGGALPGAVIAPENSLFTELSGMWKRRHPESVSTQLVITGPGKKPIQQGIRGLTLPSLTRGI